jgi:demethylmenaquinone methyltransferase / 2-methoxy-6-polyprenyl-1,4-benzoquinol methylase
MSPYRHDPIVPFPTSDERKKHQVADMFDQIAFRYDFLNRFLSGGLDLHWRKRSIKELRSQNPQTILDVATGTADMPILISKSLKPEKIIGIDISEKMLEQGRKKIKKLGLEDRVQLFVADAESMDFPDDAFDAVTVAFGVRNFEHLERGLKEMHRVLKPGGKLIILEFSKCRRPLFKPFFRVYLGFLAPRIGKWISQNKEAYQYLNDSVEAFPEGNKFLEILNQADYLDTYRKTLSLGICTIYCGTKMTH